MNIILWGFAPFIILALLPFIFCFLLGLVVSLFEHFKSLALGTKISVAQSSSKLINKNQTLTSAQGTYILKKIEKPTDYKLH